MFFLHFQFKLFFRFYNNYIIHIYSVCILQETFLVSPGLGEERVILLVSSVFFFLFVSFSSKKHESSLWLINQYIFLVFLVKKAQVGFFFFSSLFVFTSIVNKVSIDNRKIRVFFFLFEEFVDDALFLTSLRRERVEAKRHVDLIKSFVLLDYII